MPKGNGKPIPKVEFEKKLNKDAAKNLMKTLKDRFEQNMSRHSKIEWSKIQQKLEANPEKLESLKAMESTGGEPDVVGYDGRKDEYIFVDCSEQSPLRRSICYDQKGEDERVKKGVNPGGNAIELAKEMGIEMLNKEQYANLQQLGEFDTKTSSWLETPEEIRELGGAIFGDRRYNTIFTYHNGAQSFYSDRGFRGVLRV